MFIYACHDTLPLLLMLPRAAYRRGKMLIIFTMPNMPRAELAALRAATPFCHVMPRSAFV